jgi:hypothetical protein
MPFSLNESLKRNEEGHRKPAIHNRSPEMIASSASLKGRQPGFRSEAVFSLRLDT